MKPDEEFPERNICGCHVPVIAEGSYRRGKNALEDGAYQWILNLRSVATITCRNIIYNIFVNVSYFTIEANAAERMKSDESYAY